MLYKSTLARRTAQVVSATAALCLLASLFTTFVARAQTPDANGAQQDRGLGLQKQATPQPTPAGASAKTVARPSLVLQTGYAVVGPSDLAYSPDGRLLATTAFDSAEVKLWDVATGRELRAFALASGGAARGMMESLSGVSAIAFSRDGRLLAAGGRDNSITVWDVKTGRQVVALAGPSNGLLSSLGVLAVIFSPDAQRLVSFGDAIRTWDVATGQATGEVPIDALSSGTFTLGSEGRLALTPDGQLALVARASDTGRRRAVKVYELASGRELRTVDLPADFPAEGPTALAATTDGRLLCAAIDTSGGGDAKLGLWDLSAHGAGRTLATIPRAAASYPISVSPDGRFVALGADQSVRVWDTATGAERHTFAVERAAYVPYQTGAVSSLAFSPDGGSLAAGTYSGPVKVWSLGTGRESQTLAGHTNFAYGVAFSADGTRLVTGGKTVWDLTTGRGLRAAQSAGPLGLLSRDGRLLATFTNRDNTVTLYDTETKRQLFTLVPPDAAGPPTLKAQQPGASAVAAGPDTTAQPPVFSPDGRLLAVFYRVSLEALTARAQQAAKVQQQNAKESQKALMKAMTEASKKAAKNPAAAAQIYQDAMAGAYAPRADEGLSNNIILWDTQTGRPAQTITVAGGMPFAPTTIKSVAFSADGRFVGAQVFGSSSVAIFDARTAAQVGSVGAQAPATANPYGMGQPGVAGAMQVPGMPGGRPYISAFAFSGDGKVVAVAGKQTQVNNAALDAYTAQMAARARDPKSARKVDPKAQRQQIEALQKQSMQQTTLTTSNALTLYDAASGRELRVLPAGESEVVALAFSADGRALAAASDDNAIRLYDAASGREMSTLKGHANRINSLAFSPDGTMLASSDFDGATLLWDAHDGRQLATLVSLYGGDEWLAVTPDGLFDGSPQAWDQVLWRYDEDTFNVAPVEWFFNEFFSPGLLADLAAGKRPRARADFADKDRRQPQVAITLADPVSAGSQIATRDVKVRVEVRDAAPDATHAGGSGAYDVRLFRNGSLVKVWHGDALNGQPAATLEATLPLVAGENRLTAYAFNRDNVKSRNAALTLDGAGSLRRAGTAYVLAVGINEYENPQYNLRYAVADAREFAAELERQQRKLGTYDHVEVTTLIDAEATKANFLGALAKLSERMQPEDELVVYFAGHGTAHENEFYLIPHDLGYAGARDALDESSFRNILAHGVSDRELETAFESINGAQLVLVIDACNSGQALEAEEKRRGPMNSKGLAQLAYEKGMYILTAAQSFQAAHEVAEVGHGLLTYALVEEGLRKGAADDEPKDGAVLIREWFDYASNRVPAMEIDKLKQSRGLSFAADAPAANDPRGLDIPRRVAQRPRVFYRRELDARPLVVARP